MMNSWDFFIKKWEQILTHPLFSVITVTALGLVFTICFAAGSISFATLVSVVLLVLTIVASMIIAFFAKIEVSPMALAQQEADKKKYIKAISILDKAIACEINDEMTCELYLLKGHINRKAKLVDEAISSYKMAISKGKFACLWSAYYELGMLYRRQYGTYSKEALESLIEARNLRILFYITPDETDVRLCRFATEIYEHNNEKDEACAWFLREMAVRESLLDINTQENVRVFYRKGEAYLNSNENLNAISEYNKALEVLEPILTAAHIQVAELYRTLGDIYWDNIKTPEHIKMAKRYYSCVLAARRKYLGNPSDNTKPFLKNSLKSLKKLADGLVSSGDQYFDKARRALDNIGTTANRGAAIDAYKEALQMMKELYGDRSLQVANIYHKLGLCYKWVTIFRYDTAKGLENLLLTVEIWEEKKDPKKHNKEFATLFVDIGGLHYMEGNYREAVKWRLKAYKSLLCGKYEIEELGRIELSLLKTYEKLQLSKPYLDFLSKNDISPTIETVTSKKCGPRCDEVTVKLKGLSEPCVWQMG